MKDEQKMKEQLIRELDEMRQQMAALRAAEAERDRIEEALRKSEARYRTTLLSVGDAIIATDAAARVELLNPVAEALTGWRQEEACGKLLEEVFHIVNEETRQPVEDPVHRVMREGIVVGLANHSLLLSRDGREIPIADSGAPIRDKKGAIGGVVLVFRDQTEERRTQRAMQEAREFAESIVATVREPLLVLDADLRMLSANRSFYRDFQVRPEETEGRLLYDLGNRQWDIPELRHLLEEILPRNTSFDDYSVTHNFERIGQRTMLLNARRLYREPNRTRMVLLAIEDITERQRADKEKEKLQAQLLQTQKMEAIGRLAGGVAHDLNNWLTAIMGFVGLMKMEVNESTSLYHDLNEVDTAAVRAADIVRQLLLFSRKQAMIFKPLYFSETTEGLLKMLHRLIGEDIAIRTRLQPDCWPVQADRASIEQVIVNLVVNARDAMPEGGNLTIGVENVTLEEADCRMLSEARPGRFVQLHVRDSGIGMDEEVMQHLFEPFFTTKGLGKGTGMGLAVVYGIVQEHKGWINVYSKPGRGSTFKVYLPVSSVEVEEKEEAEVLPEAFRGAGERILLVEDEKSVREAIRRALTEMGYVVFEAASEVEAMDVFAKEDGKFDLLFSDVVLPGKSGLQLADEFVARRPKLHILLTSGYTDEKSRWTVIQQRKYCFLQKPYKLADLMRAVKEAIKRA